MQPQLAEPAQHFRDAFEIGDLEGARIVVELGHGLLLQVVGQRAADHDEDREEAGDHRIVEHLRDGDAQEDDRRHQVEEGAGEARDHAHVRGEDVIERAMLAPVDEAGLGLEQPADQLEAHAVDHLGGHHGDEDLVEEGRGDDREEGQREHRQPV